MKNHPAVEHPNTRISQPQNKFIHFNDAILTFLTDHVLASVFMFDLALVLPLIVIPMNNTAKLILALVSGSWIQWWALPALQRSANKADVKRDAKADVDHEALTSLHIATDGIAKKLEQIKKNLDDFIFSEEG